MGARGSMISAAKVCRRGLPPQVTGAGQAAGDDDDVGVDHGDQSCQGSAQAGGRVAVDLRGDVVPGSGALLDPAGVGNVGISALGQVAAVDLGPGGDALQVPRPAAGAGFALGPGDGDVADLAGHVMGAPAGSPIEDEGAADPGAHRHHEDDLGPGAAPSQASPAA